MTTENREQIVKALEICTDETTEFCTGCPFIENGGCKQSSLLKLALALIRELTEENKKLTINMNAYGLTAKRLAEENEMLRESECDFCACTLLDERDNAKAEVAKIKADTVRKMQERLKEHLEKPEFPWDSFTVAEEYIEQIAKEMLEEE